jgi:hypothetical protein
MIISNGGKEGEYLPGGGQENDVEDRRREYGGIEKMKRAQLKRN